MVRPQAVRNNVPGRLATNMQSRGPMAQRGLQFSQTALPELVAALARTRTRLQLIEGIDRSSLACHDDIGALQVLSQAERTELRRQAMELQTDLRAELRRRTQS